MVRWSKNSLKYLIIHLDSIFLMFQYGLLGTLISSKMLKYLLRNIEFSILNFTINALSGFNHGVCFYYDVRRIIAKLGINTKNNMVHLNELAYWS